MTWLAFASLLLGLACVPLLDPPSSRYLRAVGRARRVRRLRESRWDPSRGEREHLQALIDEARKSQLFHLSSPPNYAAAAASGERAGACTRSLTKLVNEARATPLRTEGDRPAPSALPKSKPPGPSPISRKPRMTHTCEWGHHCGQVFCRGPRSAT